jgi:hypothetical protein
MFTPDTNGDGEHPGIVRAHDRLLLQLRSSWDDVRPLPLRWCQDPAAHRFRLEAARILKHDFATSRIWAVKDPRMCRLAPIWASIFQDLGCRFAFVLIFRHPEEVARSLERRAGFHREKSTRLWLENTLAAERSTRDFPRAFIHFDSLLSNGPAALARIQETAGFRFPTPIKEVREEIHGFLNPKLRNHAVNGEPTFETVGQDAALLRSVYSTLCRSSAGETVQTIRAFDDLHEEYERVVAGTERAMMSHIADLHDRVRVLGQTLDEFQSSPLRRVARPWRNFERMVSRVFLS